MKITVATFTVSEKSINTCIHDPYHSSIFEARHEITNNVVCATSKGSDQPAPCAYAQSDQSLCLSLEYFMNVKLLTEHHLEFLSL